MLLAFMKLLSDPPEAVGYFLGHLSCLIASPCHHVSFGKIAARISVEQWALGGMRPHAIRAVT